MSSSRSLIVVGAMAALLVRAPRVAHAAPAAPWLSVIPDDTTFLAVTDVKAARSSPLFASVKKSVLEHEPTFSVPFAAAKLDPFKLVDRVAVFAAGDPGIAGGGHIRVAGIVFEGSFPAEFPINQVSAIAKTSTALVEVRTHGKFPYLIVDNTVFAHVGRRLYVGSLASADELLAIADGEPMSDGSKPAARSPRAQKLRNAIAGIDSRSQSWLVAVGPTMTGFAAVAAGHAVSWIGLAISLHKTAELEIRVQLADPTAATEVASSLGAALALPSTHAKAAAIGLSTAADSMTFFTDGARLSIATRLLASELASLAHMGHSSP